MIRTEPMTPLLQRRFPVLKSDSRTALRCFPQHRAPMRLLLILDGTQRAPRRLARVREQVLRQPQLEFEIRDCLRLLLVALLDSLLMRALDDDELGRRDDGPAAQDGLEVAGFGLETLADNEVDAVDGFQGCVYLLLDVWVCDWG